MNYSVNDDASKTLHDNEKNVGADTGVCPYTLCLYTISLPNGVRAMWASLKCCLPKGMPMMVI